MGRWLLLLLLEREGAVDCKSAQRSQVWRRRTQKRQAGAEKKRNVGRRSARKTSARGCARG